MYNFSLELSSIHYKLLTMSIAVASNRKKVSESFPSKVLIWASCKSGNEAKMYKIIGPQAAEEVKIHKGSDTAPSRIRLSAWLLTSPVFSFLWST